MTFTVNKKVSQNNEVNSNVCKIHLFRIKICCYYKFKHTIIVLILNAAVCVWYD